MYNIRPFPKHIQQIGTGYTKLIVDLNQYDHKTQQWISLWATSVVCTQCHVQDEIKTKRSRKSTFTNLVWNINFDIVIN